MLAQTRGRDGTGMCLSISHPQSRPAPQKGQLALIHKADLNTNADSGHMGPWDIWKLELPQDRCGQDPMRGPLLLTHNASRTDRRGSVLFPEANGGPKGFIRAFAFTQERQGSPELA